MFNIVCIYVLFYDIIFNSLPNISTFCVTSYRADFDHSTHYARIRVGVAFPFSPYYN